MNITATSEKILASIKDSDLAGAAKATRKKVPTARNASTESVGQS